MRNPKSSTTRKVRSRRISTPPARHATTTCRRAVESETSPTQSKSRITHYASRTRNGKVARLPYPVRDMINRMLRNNIPHSQIVDALDELQFKVTERNISNWKTRGGYRDWCIAQDRALETRLLQDNLLAQLRTNDASQLAEVGLQLAATQLSQFFLKPETREQLTAEPEKLARTIGILCRLARQIHILQKYRDQFRQRTRPRTQPRTFQTRKRRIHREPTRHLQRRKTCTIDQRTWHFSPQFPAKKRLSRRSTGRHSRGPFPYRPQHKTLRGFDCRRTRKSPIPILASNLSSWQRCPENIRGCEQRFLP